MILRKKTQKKRLILGLLCLIVLAAGFLNFEFFWAEWKYYFVKIPKAVSTSLVETKLAPDTLFIESLQIETPVIYVTETTDQIFEAALARGVVHYPGTAVPGELGNIYLFGHSSDYVWVKGDYKTIFALLPKIQIGARILLSDSQGKIFQYIVKDKFVVKPNDLSVVSQKNYTKKLLTLQTSYPLGTALKRFIVVAEEER